MELNVDDVITEVGEFGLYQKLCLYLIILPVCTLSGIQFQKQVIMTSTPDHWCRPPPGLPMGSSTGSDLPNDVIRRMLPLETKADGVTRYSRCHAYVDWPVGGATVTHDAVAIKDINGTHAATDSALYAHLTSDEAILTISTGSTLLKHSDVTTSRPIEACQNGWQYDHTHFTSTAVSEWNLVCGRSVLASVALCLFLFGGVIGVILTGYIADRWGRKMALLVSLGISSAADFISYFCTSFTAWLIFRSLAGLSVPSTYQLSFIIGIEMVGVHHRSFVTVAIYFFFSVGLVLVCGIMYALRDWAMLTLTTSIPSLIILASLKFAPESPRWLITQGNYENTMRTLGLMCKVNGTKLSESVVDLLKEKDESRRAMKADRSKLQPAQHDSFLSLFRTPNMRRKTIIIVVVWFINITVYSGLSIFAPVLGTNPYMSLFLSSVIELPSHGILLWVMEWWSRRFSMTVLMVVGGVSCLVTMLVPPDDTIAHLLLFLVGKFSLSATFLILYAFGGELYPTEVRGKGLALSSYTGMLGSCLSPFIDLLGVNHLTMPLIIMGLASVFGGILCLLLPETLHQKLPETLAEGETFGQLFEWKTFFVCLPKIDVESPANVQGPRGNRRPSLVPTLLFPILSVTTLVSDPIFANTRYTSSPHIRDIITKASQHSSRNAEKPS